MAKVKFKNLFFRVLKWTYLKKKQKFFSLFVYWTVTEFLLKVLPHRYVSLSVCVCVCWVVGKKCVEIWFWHDWNSVWYMCACVSLCLALFSICLSTYHKKIRSTRNLTTSSICISSNVIYIKVHKIYFFAWENRKCYNSIRFLLLREQNIISALFSDFITGVWCCSFRCEWCWNVKIRRTFFWIYFFI